MNAVVALLLAASSAAEQRLDVGIGLEPELTTTVGYTRRLVDGPPFELDVGGGLKVAPAILLGAQAVRAQAIATVVWRSPMGLGAEITALPYFLHTAGRASTADGVGLELRAAPGYLARRWSLTLDLGYQATLLAYLRHTALIEDAYGDRYPAGTDGAFTAPVDGWYGLTAQRLRMGLRGGVRFGDHVDVRLALGSLFSVQRQGVFFGFNMGQVPLYAEAGVAIGW